MAFDTQSALKAGYSQQEINGYLAKQSAANAPKKVGGMKGMIANLLPLIGGTVGAVGGSVLGPIGTAVGGGGLSALGEFAKQKLLGEKTNLGSIAGQGAMGALPGVFSGLGKGMQALKGVSGAKALAETGTLAESAGAAEKALQGSESMAAATKAASVPKIGKTLAPTRTTGPMELQPQRTIVNPTIGETKDLANSSMGLKTGRLQTDAYNTPFIQSGKTPVVRGTTMDVNAPLKVETPTQAPTSKVEAPVNPASDPYVRVVSKDGSETYVPASMASKAPTNAVAPEQMAPAAVSEPLPKPVSKLEKSAQNSENNRAQSLFGKDNTTTKDYQTPLNDTRRKELAAYSKSKGIDATQPQKAAQQLEANHQQVTKNLNETLTKTNRPVTQAERDKLAKDIETAWSKNTNIASSNPKLKKDILDRIRHAQDSKDLESLAKYRSGTLDAGAKFNAAGDAAGTANSTINKVARDAVSKFTGNASPEYKAAQQEFRISKEATARANASSGRVVDAKIPIVNLPVRGSGQAVEGTLNKVRDIKAAATRSIDKAANGTGEAGVAPSKIGFMPYVKSGVKQSLSRSIAGPLLPDGMQPEQAQADVAAIDQYDNAPTPDVTPQTPKGPFTDPQKVQQAYMAALADGNTKAASMIMDGYKMFGPNSSANKPLSTTAATAIANANAGIASIDNVISQMQQDPSVQKKSIIPGRGMFGGAGANLLGTGQYDASIQQAKDIIQRLRTGAAISTSEASFYNQMMPQAFDSPETTIQKLQTLRTMFQTVATRGQNGTLSDGTNNDNTASILSNAGVQ